MEAKRRKVLVPIPAQGHVTPMMQLGKALNSKGFSITVVEGHFNQVNSSSQHFPCFKFVTIKESLPESEFGRLGGIEFMLTLNKTSEASFKDSISLLLLQQGNDIACIIFDEYMYFCGAAAKEFNLPSVIFSTQSAANYVSHPDMQDKVVENLYPLRYKDLPTSGMGPLDRFFELCREVANKRTASAVIINTVSCLENSSLSWLEQKVGISVYPLGPLHMTASPPSSLLEEDRSCIEWLNKQKPRSVIYISIGTLGQLETKEVLEMAWGLCNSNQPFLWVIRAGSILGTNGIESLPEDVNKMVSERIHCETSTPDRSTWTSCNGRLLEPLWMELNTREHWRRSSNDLQALSWRAKVERNVYRKCLENRVSGHFRVNARYLECVWKIGIQVEGDLDRGAVERAVKRLMVFEEGEEMRKRAVTLKEELRASIRGGGSLHNSLKEFEHFMMTL
ncbi:hypothetical protein ISN45_At03g038840 [Arabidopsis thaliana x Arabidopsis arenosa]|uniref:Glycosyltransferase n=1 Tax=Arabidopsis thaliana x Arabidopsis arenosa TaxID=1240361 RepID=A0A8T2ETT3_9BRAS|nr:hypothetical protein ISN45_At03g038840 [Arabidopsis thaliana x Arabidopsis arenosa]